MQANKAPRRLERTLIKSFGLTKRDDAWLRIISRLMIFCSVLMDEFPQQFMCMLNKSKEKVESSRTPEDKHLGANLFTPDQHQMELEEEG